MHEGCGDQRLIINRSSIGFEAIDHLSISIVLVIFTRINLNHIQHGPNRKSCQLLPCESLLLDLLTFPSYVLEPHCADEIINKIIQYYNMSIRVAKMDQKFLEQISNVS